MHIVIDDSVWLTGYEIYNTATHTQRVCSAHITDDTNPNRNRSIRFVQVPSNKYVNAACVCVLCVWAPECIEFWQQYGGIQHPYPVVTILCFALGLNYMETRALQSIMIVNASSTFWWWLALLPSLPTSPSPRANARTHGASLIWSQKEKNRQKSKDDT